ncbi:helix-turn-helix domain-containing protein [Luteimonas soli]|uniref:Helix-turn-helix domain-containing protein n=1 Tax=Luteimonas soli TaxID=1648966 RepID=A0ABV7XKZ5_9GAMM
MAAGFELTIRFVTWMQQQRQIPHYEVIAAEFGVHRATAHRWRRAYLAATGQFDPLARDTSPAATGTHPHTSRSPQ